MEMSKITFTRKTGTVFCAGFFCSAFIQQRRLLIDLCAPDWMRD